MASYEAGKREVCEWIRNNFRSGSTCLDVGACDGNWNSRLGDWLHMDAVEIFAPYIINNRLEEKYDAVYNCDISKYTYWWYDLIIFGDVIEHMPVEKAQRVLAYADKRCTDMIIAVPYLYQQGPLNGNEYESHLQPDLTEEIFRKRYPGYEVLYRPNDGYCYYHKGERENGKDNGSSAGQIGEAGRSDGKGA